MTAPEDNGSQVGRRTKASKGTVKIENDKSWLRLRFSFQGRRYAFSLSLPDTKTNRTVAEHKVKQIELDILSGNFDPSLKKYKPERQKDAYKEGRLTVVALFRQFLEYKAKEVSPKTMEKYKATLGYISRFFLDKPVEFLSEKDVDAFAKWQSGQELSAVQVKRRLEELEACWKWHKAEYNPWAICADRIKIPPKQLLKPFTLEELTAIVQAFRTDRYYHHYTDYVEFLFGTGCRTGEAIGLRRKHISDDCLTVWIGEIVTRGARKPAKRNRARTITLSAKIQKLLLSRRPSNPNPNDLVFTSPTGKAIDDRNFRNRAWVTVLTRLGIDYRKPYNTRHTLISHALDLGMNPVTVAQLTGHDVETLYKNYAGNVNSRPVLPEL